jgi:ketosteroid isomerase-like protein
MRLNLLPVKYILLALLACDGQEKKSVDLEQVKEEVVQTDMAFSDYSARVGFPKALAHYAADQAIKLNNRSYSFFGKLQLEQEAASDTIGNSEGTLTWAPLHVVVSERGDMAASFGDWYYNFKSSNTNQDTTLYGNYISVWKKQQDGVWKFIMDGGNATPGPTTDELLSRIK